MLFTNASKLNYLPGTQGSFDKFWQRNVTEESIIPDIIMPQTLKAKGIFSSACGIPSPPLPFFLPSDEETQLSPDTSARLSVRLPPHQLMLILDHHFSQRSKWQRPDMAILWRTTNARDVSWT